ncbi:MAG: 16S rRNA (cytosine(1402)-N(4))-methyltransferase RsmH [Stellaceae bacterium]
MSGGRHIPVLLAETLQALEPKDGALYLDGTFGGGGWTRALLQAARCTVIAIDRDPESLRGGATLVVEHAGRVTLVEGRFSDMERLLTPLGVTSLNGVALDLGVSSPQLDRAERGFSVRSDGPLDMRMEPHGPAAADLVNTLPEAALSDLIRRYGEERFARRVARAIVRARSAAPITRTLALANLVRAAVPEAGGIDPATRTFQALRIAVNDELGELERGLAAAERLLLPGGRLAIVSFHSLEDRTVKTFLRQRSGEAARPSRHAPPGAQGRPSFRLLRRKPVVPSAAEINRNPRARSARLRAAERTAAPAWSAA